MIDGALRSQKDVEDFVRGCAFFGSGGGGNPRRGLELLTGALQQNGSITWLDPAHVADDAWVLFKGKVVEKFWEDRDGYMYGHGLAVMGPRYYGFDLDYLPIEAIMEQN